MLQHSLIQHIGTFVKVNKVFSHIYISLNSTYFFEVPLLTKNKYYKIKLTLGSLFLLKTYTFQIDSSFVAILDKEQRYNDKSHNALTTFKIMKHIRNTFLPLLLIYYTKYCSRLGNRQLRNQDTLSYRPIMVLYIVFQK